jgi:3-oxoacyl-[acyl-carrier-protein] synthase-3
VFDQQTVRRKAQAAVPGDGAAVGLVTVSDRSPILDVECRTNGEFAAGPAARW